MTSVSEVYQWCLVPCSMSSLQGFLEAHNLTSEALLCDSRLLSCCHVALLSYHFLIYFILFSLPYAAVALLTGMLATQ
jgi:hypothetical protein